MKFSKLSQLFLVSSIGLLVATLLTACQLITVDYLYVADSSGSGNTSEGQIQTFAVDSQSGALRTVHTAVDSGGVNPVSLAATPGGLNLYAVNQADNTLVHFSIDVGGALTKKDSVTLASQGTVPVSIATNAAGTYLFVVSQSHPGTSGQVAGGVLAVFPIGSGGAIGTALTNGSLNYWPLTLPSNPNDLIVPTAVTVLPDNNAVYITAYDKSAYNPGGSTTSAANPGWVFGFGIGSGGNLTPVSGSPFQAGVKPSALAADPTSRFVYVTDYASNQLIGYTVASGETLAFMVNGPFITGNEPSGVAVDPRGKYMYVSNALDSTVSPFNIQLADGTPTAAVNAAGVAANNTDTQPVAIAIDPALGRFVYTANYLGNSLSGFHLDPNSGVLTTTQSTPYPTGSKPTAMVILPHGNHSTQSVTP
jgi:6-phosphogluconolactonase (cycloisomerase 2 family)